MQVNSFAPSGGWPGRQILKRIWVAKPFDLPAQLFNLQFRRSELGCVGPLSQIGAGREDWYQFETGGREVRRD